MRVGLSGVRMQAGPFFCLEPSLRPRADGNFRPESCEIRVFPAKAIFIVRSYPLHFRGDHSALQSLRQTSDLDLALDRAQRPPLLRPLRRSRRTTRDPQADAAAQAETGRELHRLPSRGGRWSKSAAKVVCLLARLSRTIAQLAAASGAGGAVGPALERRLRSLWGAPRRPPAGRQVLLNRVPSSGTPRSPPFRCGVSSRARRLSPAAGTRRRGRRAGRPRAARGRGPRR